MTDGYDAIVLFCHGARRAGWREPFDHLRHELAGRTPGVRVELAFLEFMQPGLADTLDRLGRDGAARVLVVPVFLAPGSHSRQDLPALLDQARGRWPAMTIDSRPTLMESAPLRAAVIDWILRP